jgi:hypothetical protein
MPKKAKDAQGAKAALAPEPAAPKPFKHCGPSYSLHNLPRYPTKMRELTQPHRDSFDFFLEHALHEGTVVIA